MGMTEQEVITYIEQHGFIYDYVKDMAINAIKELNMYKEGGLVLIPSDVFKNQCERLDELESLQNPLEVDEILLHDGKIGYQCKNCGNELAVNEFNGKYCHWCGQKLLWSNKDE